MNFEASKLEANEMPYSYYLSFARAKIRVRLKCRARVRARAKV